MHSMLPDRRSLNTSRCLGLAGMLAALALVVAGAAQADPEVQIGPVADWVTPFAVEPDSAAVTVESDGSGAYLLCDYQDHVPQQQHYRHFAVKVLNSEGIQDASAVSVGFDPTYQTLRFHFIRILRGGRTIDKLSLGRIETLQREESMERHLYDGSLTALSHLTDVRVGDVIEHAYTITGFNPIHAGGYDDSFYLQFPVPVGEMVVRVVAGIESPLRYRLENGAPEPELRRADAGQEFLWRARNIPARPFEFAEPSWYNAYPVVTLSTWSDWSEVVAWALPHYSLAPADLQALQPRAEGILSADGKEERILQAIRFVQDDVRYLGFEGGLGAYRPHPPAEVLERRYGDCKDKSLLLVALLGTMGVKAQPVLVNTSLCGHMEGRLPGPGQFDHCIARFEHHGRVHYVDPTASNQGGDLDHLAKPPWGQGLPLAPGISGLESMADPEMGRIRTTMTVAAADFDSAATLTIESRCEGTSADNLRSTLASYSRDEINRHYVDYYAESYPGLTLGAPLQVLSDDRERQNVIEMLETYTVPGFWKNDGDGTGSHRAELHPVDLYDYVGWEAAPGRAVPLAIGMPIDHRLEFIALLPEPWSGEEEKVSIEGEAFRYTSEMRLVDDRVEVSYHYRRDMESVPPAEVAAFVADHKRIEGDLGIYLTQGADGPGFVLNWFAVVLAAFALGAGTLGALWLHRSYDPGPPSGRDRAASIGGWLVLPAIGVVVRPLAEAYAVLVPPDYFNLEIWTALMSGSGGPHASGMLAMHAGEMAVGCLGFVYGILLLVQFFQRRSSLPRLYIIGLVVTAVWVTVDSVLGYVFFGEFLSEADKSGNLRDVTRTIGSAAIWVPYFLVSAQVRRTFVVTRARPEPAAVRPGVDAGM